MQIDGFIDKAEFKKQTDDWIQVFRNTKTRSRHQRSAYGVEIRNGKRMRLGVTKEFRY